MLVLVLGGLVAGCLVLLVVLVDSFCCSVCGVFFGVVVWFFTGFVGWFFLVGCFCCLVCGELFCALGLGFLEC